MPRLTESASNAHSMSSSEADEMDQMRDKKLFKSLLKLGKYVRNQLLVDG